MTSKETDCLKLLLIAMSKFDDPEKWIIIAQEQIGSESGIKILQAIKSWKNEDIKECSSDMLDQLDLVKDQNSFKSFIDFWC